jgi:Zn-dependent protease with chaperone function
MVITVVMAISVLTWSDSKPPATRQTTEDPTAAKIFWQEARLVQNMHNFRPLVETYVQNVKPDAELGTVPVSDAYFFGRLVLDKRGLVNINFENKKRTLRSSIMERLTNSFRMNYLPSGFMQLVMLNNNFDERHYQLTFVHAQFLGEIRTLVFDVVAKPHFKGPHFVGRIWVEDRDYNIVRINGSYEPQSSMSFYFHFDTWRLNMQPNLWLPAYVYTEESDTKYMFARKLSMKGQTRLWGYGLKPPGREDEMTAIQVDPKQVSDQSDQAANEYNPLRSQEKWERESEDNVLERMERAGVLAPDGDVSKVLETVANNLVITNQLNISPPVRCRVLLTTPFETFTVGHTIIISRGLLDVLPDEPALAAVMAHELAHIVLNHRVDTRYAFSNRLLFPDEQVFRRLSEKRDPREEEDADKKALELLSKSPYQDKLGEAALFFKALQDRSWELSSLVTPHFGNRMAKKDDVLRMPALLQQGERLQKTSTTQIAALPLGSRIKLDPWDDRLEMKKTGTTPLRSARDKMPFEVTPVFPNLVRFNAAPQVAKTAEQTAPAK